MNRAFLRFRTLALAAALVAVALLSRAAAAGGVALSGAAMDDYLTRLSRFGASGAVLVIRDGQVAYQKGFGWADRARRRPMTPETGVDIASMSKDLTAVAVLQQEERGRLKLSDSLATYFEEAPADKRGITIEQLLTHRSGLPAYFVEGNDFTPLTRAQACDSIFRATLEFQPGTDEGYSDAGYVLLAILLERITGVSLEVLLERDQFRPAGLRHTFSYGTPALRMAPRIAHGYTESRDAGSPTGYVQGPDYWVVKGAGGIVSTVADLARWEVALRSGRLLGPRALARLLGAGPGDSTALAGLPEELPGGRRGWIRTGSQDFGFSAGAIRYVESGTLAVVALNRQPEGMDIAFPRTRLLMDLDGFVAGAVPPLPPAGSDRAGSIPPGDYAFPDGSRLRVTRDDEGNLIVPDGPLAVELLSYPTDTGEREARLALAPRAADLLARLCADEPEPLRQALARPSERIEAYLRKVACGDSSARIRAVGSVPHWWGRSTSRAPATLMEVGGPAGITRLRFEWVGDRIGAVGGGGITAPVVRFIAGRGPAGFVGYHLGIGAETRLNWNPAPADRDRIVVMATDGQAFVATRVTAERHRP